MRGAHLIGAACALLCWSVAASAQLEQPEPLDPPPPELPSVSDYSLPPGEDSSPTQEPAQGPAADEIPPPASITPAAEPTEQPVSPVPTESGASPSDGPPTQPPELLDPAIDVPLSETTPAGEPPSLLQSPTAGSTPPINPPPVESGPAPGFSFSPDPSDPPPAPAAEPLSPSGSPDGASGSAYLPVLGLALLVLLGLGGFFWWRKNRARAKPAERFLPTEPANSQPLPKPEIPDLGPLLEPKPEPSEPAMEPVEPPDESVSEKPSVTPPTVQNFGSARPQRWGHLKIEFIAESASSTLINALVNYRIILTNTGGDRLTDLEISGAMAQAEKDIAMSDLEFVHALLHELPSLASGQSVACEGQLRLPLTAIRPIAFQSQALFIPLARFAVEYHDGDGEKQRQAAAFVVGREYDPPRQKMAPFRLDLGPGNFSPVGQRPLGA